MFNMKNNPVRREAIKGNLTGIIIWLIVLALVHIL